MPQPFVDPETGFAYPGPDFINLDYTPTANDLEEAVRATILSASGWRKIFAIDGEEESPSPHLRQVDRTLAFGMADAFAGFLAATTAKARLRVAVGIDARFTGPILADGMVRILLSYGIEVDYLGIVAAPQIMAWVQTAGIHDGFLYVSASHNPIGHNGVKFGFGNGGVLAGAPSAELILRFKSAALLPEQASNWIRRARDVAPKTVQAVLAQMPWSRSQSAQAYASLSDEILTLTGQRDLQTSRKSELKRLAGSWGLGLVSELNGSARGLSIDKSWLGDLGVKVISLNDRPGQIVHKIVPEGDSLNLCCQRLEEAHAADPSYSLGYVPDCDGDRGNVVFFDTHLGRARILEAQEVFALCVLSELAGLCYYGESGPKVAVVCNDPTSLRIDDIARVWGAQVARAEVGEANVVNLARSLRDQGWTVRILGEGSNGGNITYPGSVRDPLSTLGSLLKLLCIRSTPAGPGLFELWCSQSGQPTAYTEEYTLADVMATLPAWTTTPTSQERAILKIQTVDHGLLKRNFEILWTQEWSRTKASLGERYGVVSWEEINFEGTSERTGSGSEFRTGRQTGGLKILLKSEDGSPRACLWMRGSGTEPVFRILAEVKGNDPEGERELLEWLTRMVRVADR